MADEVQLMKLTADKVDEHKRTPEEIKVLARQAVLGEALVTNDPEVIQWSFGLILSGMDIEEEAAEKIAALIGERTHVIGDRGINGYPMFSSVKFLHVDDAQAFSVEVKAILKALGFEQPEQPDQEDKKEDA